MRNLAFVTALIVVGLGWTSTASAQSGSVPDCDVCKICKDELYVELLPDFEYDVIKVTLLECLTAGCESQDVSDDLYLPMTGGDVRDVVLSEYPSVLHYYIAFTYCTDSSCSSNDYVIRDLENCGSL